MVQRSLAVVAPVPPAARVLAERVGAVRLPAPARIRRRVRRRPGLGPDVVCVVTGDGIGRVLAHLRAGDVPTRLLWVVRSPRAVYGDAVVEEVLATPGRPTVWDTARLGEPDLLRLAYAAHRSGGAAEVVCVTAGGPALARALRRHGVPASDLPPTL